MIFGDIKDFAIEAYHEPSGPKWGGCGRLCLHIHGVPVGNIRDNHCSLFAVTDRFRDFADTIENVWHGCFDGLPDTEVFRLIDNEIYTDEPPSELSAGFLSCEFLTNSAEMFNNTKSFIFCHPSGQVHMPFQLPDHTFGSGCCSVQTFRNVVEAYIRWFDEQVQTTAPPYFPVNPFDLNEKVPDDWNA